LFSLSLILVLLPLNIASPGALQLLASVLLLMVTSITLILTAPILFGKEVMGCFLTAFSGAAAFGHLVFNFMKKRGIPRFPPTNKIFTKILVQASTTITLLENFNEPCPIGQLNK